MARDTFRHKKENDYQMMADQNLSVSERIVILLIVIKN
jgi:hypothetical protein